MNRLIIEIEKRDIRLHAATSLKNPIVLETVGLPMTEAFANGAFLEQPEAFADYLLSGIKAKASFKSCKTCAVILDNTYVLNKDFSHIKITDAQLAALSEIEAEAIASGKVSDYVLLTRRYGDAVFLDGYQKSMVSALSKRFIGELEKRFDKSGVAITVITAKSSLYSDYAEVGAEKAAENYTAFINFGKQKTLLSIFEGGSLVFEGSFASVYSDMIDEAAAELNLDPAQAERMFDKSGLKPDDPLYASADSLPRKIEILLDTSMMEIMRTVKTAASTQRKSVGTIYVTGDMAAIPGFEPHFIDGFGEGCKVLRSVKDRYFWRYADSTKQNFLLPVKKVKLQKRKLNSVFALLVLLTAVTFAVEPAAYFYSSRLLSDAKAMSGSAGYAEVKAEIENAEALKAQAEKLKLDADLLSKTDSGAVARSLISQIETGATIQSFTYHADTRVCDLILTVPSYDSFVSLKNALNASGKYAVAVPFSSSGAAVGVSVTMSVQIK